MISRNPFSGRGSPVSGERLVGRRLLLDRLMMRIFSEAHCSIVGLPRMGKTSIAREVLSRLDTAATGLVGGYLTLDAIRGPIQAYTRILDETSADESEVSSFARTSDHDEAYENFLKTLRKRGRSGLKSVIVVDEMDAIVRDDFSDAQLFVSRIREVANDRKRYGIVFIFVSRRSLDMIQGAVDCSTLAGLCEVMYLQPLEPEGLKELTNRSTLPVTNGGYEALWRFTGGHPFLAEVVMCEAIELGVSQLNTKSIESAQHAQTHEFSNQYRQLSNLFLHERMFDSLCELVVGPQWRPIMPHTISLLKHYGVLRSSEELSGGVECMSEHFRDYLSLIARTTPSWALLGDTERQLRYLVQDRMVDAYGENWLADLQKKFPKSNDPQKPKLGDALDKMLQQRHREKRMFGETASEFILDYAYIGDLTVLIFAEWERYRTVLGGSKADWERKFQDIMKVRNPIAHHRPVPADVLNDAESSCKALLRRLGATPGS